MKNVLKKIKEKIGRILFSSTLGILLTSNAYAQASGGSFGTVADGDMSKQFLGQIFGGLVGGGVDAFGSSIATFNSAVLIVGGILVAYTILAGTLGTAHDGEMLGKKFSSVWVPIRTVLGTALVLPVYSGGYCTMQAIVMWLILQGVSLANMVWTSYIGNTSESNLAPKLYANNKTQIKQFISDTYAVQACLSTYAQSEADSNLSNIEVQKGKWIFHDGWTDGQANGDEPESYVAGNSEAYGGDRAICGSLTYPSPKFANKVNPNGNIGNTTGLNGGSNSSISSIQNLKSRFSTVNTKPIYDAIVAQTSMVKDKTRPISDAAIIAKDNGAAAKASLNDLVTSYENSVIGAANGVMQAATKDIANAAKSEGWFTAGTFATRIILIQNIVQSTINNVGVAWAKPMTQSPGMSYNKAKFNEYATNSRGWIGGWGETDAAAINNSNGGSASPNDALDGVTGWIAKKIVTMISSIDLDTLSSDTRHPILVAQQMGESLIAAVTKLVIGLTIGGGVAAKVGAGSVVSGFLTGLALPIAAFYGVGFMLAYAVPNLPLLLWFGIIIGWSIMVVEAIIAAPLWAVMHLHPSGDDMTGKGGQGYMLVLGLVVRPALIIFGLIAAITLSDLFGQFLNAIFLSSFVSPPSTWKFVNIIMLALMYGVLMVQIINSTFSLMHKIPDQLLRWIGGGSEQLGQFASEMSGAGMQKFVAGAGGVMGGVLKETSSLGQSINQKQIESKKDKAAALKAEEQQIKDMYAEIGKESQDCGHGSSEVFGAIASMAGEVTNSKNPLDTIPGIQMKNGYASDAKSLPEPFKATYNNAFMSEFNRLQSDPKTASLSYDKRFEMSLNHAQNETVNSIHPNGGLDEFKNSGMDFKTFMASKESGGGGNPPPPDKEE